MVSGSGKATADFMKTLMVICVISVPLGIWKMVDIAIWLFNNIHIGN